MTGDFLERISKNSRSRVEMRKESVSMGALESYLPSMAGASVPSLYTALSDMVGTGTIGIIGEYKRASPSKGVIRDDSEPGDVIRGYARAGVIAASILTEESGFLGSLDHLRRARAMEPDLPLLMKDFVIDPYQIMEGRTAGASAILLIATLLGPARLREFIAFTHSLHMDALVEVHTEDELTFSLDSGARIIGVNTRDLKTFESDPRTADRLAEFIPPTVLGVAESGIQNARDLRRLSSAGYLGALVGESLMRAEDPYIGAKRLVDAGHTTFPLLKVCGVASPEAALLAAGMGADMIGIIFVAESPRKVGTDTAEGIVSALSRSRSSPFTIGVFKDQPVEYIASITEYLGLWGVQLHGDEQPGYCRELKTLLPGVRLIKAMGIPIGGLEETEKCRILEDMESYASSLGTRPLFLLDTKGPQGCGGTGMSFDWSLVRFIRSRHPEWRIILSGGLGIDNKGAAWETTGAWALDANSRLEVPGAPGKKDPELVRAFLSDNLMGRCDVWL